ncbi:alpha/beta hydrolase [Arthrobacter sp. MYb211]|uniref:alpha/beta fold hydrolase n=1 Tax=unclassified Arthrobacter TaxID=235627 RepID=UPI000CFD935D|nr:MULTISPECIES: alpha/beta fold hydrolase [unclassified Arthrobacter]PRA03021.1 alpha/beta hydrolase [Arthrobacter sp. MYb229]PRA11016.1 alpha/beta hydrolase [Arthrobacter sp. MYb221]PRB49491.1 alpha/beta hydrolase [Arthrobacter sp. MYb216]PRC07171.1 alpha/beta hydrolase [Arthrobacter sp. MYb211]
MAVPHLTPSLLHTDKNLPTLVVGPSLGTSSLHLWGPAVPALMDHFQIVAWDLPGHGASKPSTEEFSLGELATGVITMIDALRADSVISEDSKLYYAGVSVGGATALQLAVDYPGTFDGLSSICAAAKIGTPEGWTERAELVAKAGTPTMIAGSAQRWFAPGFIEKQPVISTDLLHNLQDADRFAYAHVCGALAGFDVRERLAATTDPILAINGAQDQVCPPADAEFIAENAPQGTAAVIDSAAHLAPAEAPEETAALLVDFFTAN